MDAAGLNLLDWPIFVGWTKQYGCRDGRGIQECNWATWRAYNSWDEYQYFIRWLTFGPQESLMYGNACYPERPCPAVGACASGTCAYKGLIPAVPVPGGVSKVSANKELYPYQYGATRVCADACPANWLDLVEVQRREACDALCDTVTVAVGLDACRSVLTWYINQTAVLTQVGIGRRMAEQYRVRENGGYASDVYVRRVLIDFGTGSLLDAALPNNYSRSRVDKEGKSGSALVSVQDNPSSTQTNYYELYQAKLGGLTPVNRSTAFAVTDAGPQYRLFGQGDVLKIQNILVLQRRSFPDYKAPRILCRPQCGTCQDRPGYCNPDPTVLDCEFDPWCGECFDTRDLSIQQVPNPGCTTFAPYGGNDLVITRVPIGQRPWQPSCKELGVGVNLYE